MPNIKRVGKSGQISVGKAMAGMDFIMEKMAGGDTMLKRAVVVPMNERWLHEPGVRAQLNRVDQWMHNTPTQETNLLKLESNLEAGS